MLKSDIITPWFVADVIHQESALLPNMWFCPLHLSKKNKASDCSSREDSCGFSEKDCMLSFLEDPRGCPLLSYSHCCFVCVKFNFLFQWLLSIQIDWAQHSLSISASNKSTACASTPNIYTIKLFYFPFHNFVTACIPFPAWLFQSMNHLRRNIESDHFYQNMFFQAQ